MSSQLTYDTERLTLATRDDGTGVTHTPSGRSSAASNEADNRLGVRASLVVLLEILGSLLLHATANLANDDDTLRAGIVKEEFYDIDVLRAGERVAANSDDERLAEANASRLRDSLIREGTGAGDDTCAKMSIKVRA